MSDIVIIDYGMGNLRSIHKAFKRIGVEAEISDNLVKISKAKKLVLPGVGHFKKGMDNLREKGMIEVLNETVLGRKTPILGICLGMQLFTSHSEEGDKEGLNWVAGNTKQFDFGANEKRLKFPHMGWNDIQVKKETSLFDEISFPTSFYFVHSYYVKCSNEAEVLCTTNYNYDFHSGLIKENIVGMQFHPEKSHSVGLKVLSNFTKNFGNV